MVKTVVVLGAGPAGVPTSHWLLKHTAAKLPNLKIILVSPNTDFFWNLAAPRVILPNMTPDEDVFYPLQPFFAKYPSDQFEFIIGKAEQLDPDTNTLAVSSKDQILSITP